jgi:hypothetical protein
VVADGEIWVERQQKSVLFFINSCSINIFFVCRRGEQGLVPETPRGEIQIPQRSGKMEADTIVLELFLLLLSPLFSVFFVELHYFSLLALVLFTE